jgi:Protein of unknown function (DUF3429)
MKADESGSAEPGPSPWARRLGFGGLIPFVTLAAALWVLWPAVGPSCARHCWATALPSLGRYPLGLVMRDGPVQPVPSLVWGVVPSLLAWLALLLAPTLGLSLIAALLWACFAVDRVLYPRYRLQAWLPMRLRLTVVASISCAAGAAASLR